MLHRCNLYPGKLAIVGYVEQQLNENDLEDEEMSLKQWVHTGRTAIVNQQMTSQDFAGNLVDKFDSLTSHDYIAKHQSS